MHFKATSKPFIMNDSQSPAEIVQDLFHIHQDRISVYKSVLHHMHDMEADVKALLERMIEESTKYAQQLASHIRKLSDIKGNIYKIWEGPKAPGDATDKKSIAKSCASDELAMVNTYSIALSSIVSDKDIEKLLLLQQQDIHELYNHILQFYNAQ